VTDALNRTIRATFEGTAGTKLRLTDAGMSIESAGRVLHFQGFHADGKPFAVTCQAFTGSPIDRAAQMATDIIQTHTGEAPMSAAVTGIALTIRERLGDSLKRAGEIGVKADAAVTNLNRVLDGAEDQIRGIDQAAADVQAALGMSSNGG
jgi:hypothetical protein